MKCCLPFKDALYFPLQLCGNCIDIPQVFPGLYWMLYPPLVLFVYVSFAKWYKHPFFDLTYIKQRTINDRLRLYYNIACTVLSSFVWQSSIRNIYYSYACNCDHFKILEVHFFILHVHKKKLFPLRKEGELTGWPFRWDCLHLGPMP